MKVSLRYYYESLAFVGIVLDTDIPPFTQPIIPLPNLRTTCCGLVKKSPAVSHPAGCTSD
jgi:hypothetical protein